MLVRMRLLIVRAGLAFPVAATARSVAHRSRVWRSCASNMPVAEFAAVVAADVATRSRRRATRVRNLNCRDDFVRHPAHSRPALFPIAALLKRFATLLEVLVSP